jgi:hypothetical protein
VALTVAEKAAVRRHLGVPAAASSQFADPAGLRTVVRMEQLENALMI